MINELKSLGLLKADWYSLYQNQKSQKRKIKGRNNRKFNISLKLICHLTLFFIRLKKYGIEREARKKRL